MVNITKNVRFFYQKSLFTKNSREFIVQYGAMILRSQSVTVIFRMTYECHTSLAHCLCTHPAPSSLRKASAVLHLFRGVCWDWLEPEAERLLLLFQSSRLGGPWAGWAAVSQRSPASLSGLPLTPTARVDPADLFHSWQRPSSPGSPLFLKSSAGPRWDSWGWTFRMRPWCEFWVWNMRLGVCVLKNFNCAFSSNVKWQRVAVYFFEPSDLESGIQCSFFSPLRS